MLYIHKCRYDNQNTEAPQLELQSKRLTDWQQERTRNRVPLGTLLQIDPNTQQVRKAILQLQLRYYQLTR